MEEIEERLLLPKHLVAKAFGISVQALTNWKVRPREKRGREQFYYLPDVIDFRLNRDSGQEIDARAERARLDKARADKTEIEIDILKGKLLPIDVVERFWSDMVSAFRAKMLGLPTKSAMAVDAAQSTQEIEQILKTQVHEALSELSEYKPEQYGEPAGGESGEAADSTAAADGEPVGRPGKKAKQRIKR